jgi:hypothetical protein
VQEGVLQWESEVVDKIAGGEEGEWYRWEELDEWVFKETGEGGCFCCEETNGEIFRFSYKEVFIKVVEIELEMLF